MFDQPREDLQRANPILVAKNIERPLEGIAPFSAAFLRGFHPRLASGNWSDFDHIIAERERDKPRQGVAANTLNAFQGGAVGFIEWWVFSAHSDSHHAQTQCGRESSYIA